MTAAEIAPGAHVAPTAVVQAGAVVGPGTVIHDEVTIGAGARIGSLTVVHAGTQVGDRCVIEDHVVLGKRPRLRRGSSAAGADPGRQNQTGGQPNFRSDRERERVPRCPQSDPVRYISTANVLQSLAGTAGPEPHEGRSALMALPRTIAWMPGRSCAWRVCSAGSVADPRVYPP